MRTGTGRRAGSSRSRVVRKPWGSATGSLHDPVPHFGSVGVEALLLRLGPDVEDTLEVAREHEREALARSRPVVEQRLCHRRLGPRDVALEQLAQRTLVLVAQREEVDHLAVDEVGVEVEDVGHAARHAGREVATRLSEQDRSTTGHVLAPVVADALDHRVSTGVADAEALADDPAQEELAG